MKDDKPHDVRQFQIGDGRGTTEDDRGGPGTTGDGGDGGGRHNVIRPGPWLLLAGRVQKMIGRDDAMPSVLPRCEHWAVV